MPCKKKAIPLRSRDGLQRAKSAPCVLKDVRTPKKMLQQYTKTVGELRLRDTMGSCSLNSPHAQRTPLTQQTIIWQYLAQELRFQGLILNNPPFATRGYYSPSFGQNPTLPISKCQTLFGLQKGRTGDLQGEDQGLRAHLGSTPQVVWIGGLSPSSF